MSRKNHKFISAEVCIERMPQDKERAHLLEHVRFLEDRTTDLETKVEILRDMFGMVLELDKEEDDEDEQEEMEDFFASIGFSLDDDDDDDDEEDEDEDAF